MPWSSPRSSGCRATDWIIEPKMLPMPTPAPRAPSPTPSARPIAFPALVTSPDVAARSVLMVLLVLRLDRRADVDGREGGEDERLDADDDDHLEEVEDGRRDQHRNELQRLEDEDQPEEGEDQDVASQHVREQPHAQRDQTHELTEDLERDDQGEEHLRCLRNPALEVPHWPVPAHALEVGEGERQQRQR